MRHVSALDAMPTREEVRARIEQPERFRPEPRLVRPIPYRRLEDGSGEVLWERNAQKGKGWEPVPAPIVAVFEALEEGLTFDEMFERAYALAPRKLPKLFERFLRKYLWDLHEDGYVHIPVEPAPDVFAGRYQRVKELGRGGMGVAHLCRDLKEGGAPVVVKHAWGWNRPIETAEYTNRREALVMAALDHPGLPRLRDTFEDRGILHMVRDFADGPTLQNLKSTMPRAPMAQRMRIGADLADVLHHMHERGYLYLDAKPGNFVLTDEGRVIVLDLGVARPHEGGALKLSTRVGSPGFTAPEIRKDGHASALSDQYSLGCVLFFLATGGRPSRSWPADGIAHALREDGVEDPERRILERMTAADPADRYPSLREARADLLSSGA